MLILCNEVIYLDSEGRTSTYCMRERDHTGEHSIQSDKEIEKKKIEEEENKELPFSEYHG